MRINKRIYLLLLLGVVFFATIYVVRISGDMADFQVNYQAGQRLRAGEHLYRTEDGHFMFKYLPFSALLYVPLTTLHLDAAKVSWYTLTVVCSVFLFYLSYRMARTKEEVSSAYLIVFPALILAKFFFREMKLGQINTIVTSIMLLMLWYLRKSEAEAVMPR